MAAYQIHALQAVVVEEQVEFTLEALCHACGAEPPQIHALIAEGLLQPAGHPPDTWRFQGSALPRARKALRLARDLELPLPAVALVMDLLAEIDGLRARLRHA